MRISIHKAEGKAHEAFLELQKEYDVIEVWFNGKKLRDVITADEEKGEVTCYKRDVKGNVVRVNATQYEAYVALGRVKIIPRNLPKVKETRQQRRLKERGHVKVQDQKGTVRNSPDTKG